MDAAAALRRRRPGARLTFVGGVTDAYRDELLARAEAAGADDQDLRGFQLLLPRPADLAQHQVAGIAFHLDLNPFEAILRWKR